MIKVANIVAILIIPLDHLTLAARWRPNDAIARAGRNPARTGITCTEMDGRQLHRGLTRVLSLVMCAIGIALVVQAFANGNPILALLGGLFFAAGARAHLPSNARAAASMSSVPGAPGEGGLPAGGEDGFADLPSRPVAALRNAVGSPLLFSIVYLPLASAIYFALGVIAGHALALTPVVLLASALMFALTAMTYVEGASLHQERGGSTVFARYAFNELVSFVAGWAILLDYVILIAITTYAATQYLRVFWSTLGHGPEALGLALIFIASVVLVNIRGLGGRRARRIGMLVIADVALQGFIVVLGLALFFNAHALFSSIHLGSAPTWSGFVFALTLTAIAFTGLETASGAAGEVKVGRRGLSAGGQDEHLDRDRALRRDRTRRVDRAAGARRQDAAGRPVSEHPDGRRRRRRSIRTGCSRLLRYLVARPGDA